MSQDARHQPLYAATETEGTQLANHSTGTVCMKETSQHKSFGRHGTQVMTLKDQAICLVHVHRYLPATEPGIKSLHQSGRTAEVPVELGHGAPSLVGCHGAHLFDTEKSGHMSCPSKQQAVINTVAIWSSHESGRTAEVPIEPGHGAPSLVGCHGIEDAQAGAPAAARCRGTCSHGRMRPYK